MMSTAFRRRIKKRTPRSVALNTASDKKARYGPQAWGFSKVRKTNRAYASFSYEMVKPLGNLRNITCDFPKC